MTDEVMYENRSIPEKSILENGLKIYFKKDVSLRILTIVMYFLMLIYGLNFYFKKNYIQMLYSILFVFCVSFSYKTAYLIIKKKQKYSFYLERTYRFYDNRLEVTTEISKLIISYDKIKIAFENNKAFYMVFERSLLCIDKNGFIVGNSVEFDKFIKSKVKFK